MRLDLLRFKLLHLLIIIALFQSLNGDENQGILERENMRYGPALLDDDKRPILYRELNKEALNMNINSLPELLSSWRLLYDSSRAKRYIAAKAISNHLEQHGLALERSLKAINQDQKSNEHIALVNELKSKLEILWELKK